jgi:hypothetical protein
MLNTFVSSVKGIVSDAGLGMVERTYFLERPLAREGENILDML